MTSTFRSLFIALLPLASCHSHIATRQNEGPGLHTLTAYAPNNTKYNGLKVEYGGYLNLFQEKTGQYCPGPPLVPNCPNGTDTVFAGTFYPSSMVPGGQEFFVDVDGATRITVQHSHSFPPGSYPYYYGWTWTALSSNASSISCPSNSTLYNCGAPSGYFTFKAPDGPPSYQGGLKACPNKYNTNGTSVYAVTPLFNLTGCVELEGLATHTYTGVNPPVWAY
ncbi:hypothetical protein K505DRAFT_415251 [Melanomma pulvis-pyrius CBS 109.77]|uniref:Ubiquitin 3 binding protein But2 C-terminal domain-containing protein n=1 Tax=Melanomma pulvis-pyrius CBS 109.77 TaxID=1314802 RepID=A0A6A6XNK9_9PLEO|nr:hypothetical protein K505DRAFT_415251 [Melanomma pulvis-pyrius CBS 109.77]